MKNIKTFEQHTSINENLLGELQRLNPERLKNDEKALDLIDDIKEDFLENGEDLRKVSILDDTTSNEISFSKIEIGKSYTLSYVFGKYHPVVRNIYSGNREAGDRRIKIVAIPFSFTISRNSLESLFRANRINLGTVRVTDVSTQHNYQRNPNIGNHALYKEKEDKYKISGDVALTIFNFFNNKYKEKYPDLKDSRYKSSLNISRIEKGLSPTLKYIDAKTKDGENVSAELRKGDDERELRKMVSNMTRGEYDKFYKKRGEKEYEPIDAKNKEEKKAKEEKINKLFKENDINLTPTDWERYGFSISHYLPGYEFIVSFRSKEELKNKIKNALKTEIDGYKGELVRVQDGLLKNDDSKYYTLEFKK
jgi:hypothetical protein